MRRTGTAALAALLASGCGEAAPDAPTAAVVDSAGVRILTYDLADVTVPTYRVVAEHDLEIGELDGPPQYTLSRVVDLAVVDEGMLVVSDGVAQELRVYDAGGEYVRTIGGRGEGPGEFATAPAIAGVAGDTVFAFDGRSRRITSYTTGGELVETMTLRVGAVGRAQEMIRLRDGTYLSRSPWTPPESGPPASYDMRLELDSIVVEHLDAAGALRDTVLVMADRNRARRVEVLAGGMMRVQQANTAYAATAFLESDGVRAIVARSDAFELHVLDPAGTPETVLRVLGVQHPATAAEIRTHQEDALRERLGEDVDPMILQLNVDFLPDRLPAFMDVVMTEEGDIWVALMEYGPAEGYDWLVFDPSGELRGLVHTPSHTQLVEVRRDYVIGVALDELDVPYVRRHPLVPADGGARE